MMTILEFEHGGTSFPNITGSVKVLENRDLYCGGCIFKQSHWARNPQLCRYIAHSVEYV